MEIKSRFSVSARRMGRSIIRELLKLANKPEIISFAGGLPCPGTFPAEELSDICTDILKNKSHVSLQYSATEGLSELRELLIVFLQDHGLSVSNDELLVTTASQQSLDLLGKIFIDRGDTVIVESPSYLGAISAFKAYGVRFTTIDMDDEGLMTVDLKRVLAELKKSAGGPAEYYQNMPKFIYTVPDFQNPSGVTMSLQRRLELLELAEEYDLLIIEDVPYRWLRYEGKEVPLISALDKGRRVINLFTFSKILSPGIRLGWVTAAEMIIDKLVQAKQSTDLCTSAFSQAIAAEYMKRGLLDRGIEANINFYREKLAVMIGALEKYMPRLPGLKWIMPEGGLFLWIMLPRNMDADDMFKKAIDHNVAYVIGSAFFPNGGGHNTIRLNFSYPSDEEIVEGIRRLAALIKEQV
ncbi:MAG: aminotransferase class I/II-fold pyridoxal phosphate-dependent enzyme [Spirochaeta sp.]|nr:aminotransferase class I/II-fold pyridoxal phosphate-dependent enzyme [Spirochaeta sp.]